MNIEKYLEYLALDSILQGYMSSAETTKNRPDYCYMWFGDNTYAKLNLTKVKNRVTELQKDFLKDYLCTDNISKEN